MLSRELRVISEALREDPAGWLIITHSFSSRLQRTSGAQPPDGLRTSGSSEHLLQGYAWGRLL